MKLTYETITDITSSVLDKVHVWQSRRLEQVYPIANLDAIPGQGHLGLAC